MPTLVCANCQVGMVVKETGVRVLELFGSPPRGYKLWPADLHACPVCDAEVAAGMPDRPLAQQFEGEFSDVLAHAYSSATVIHWYEHVADAKAASRGEPHDAIE